MTINTLIEIEFLIICASSTISLSLCIAVEDFFARNYEKIETVPILKISRLWQSRGAAEIKYRTPAYLIAHHDQSHMCGYFSVSSSKFFSFNRTKRRLLWVVPLFFCLVCYSLSLHLSSWQHKSCSLSCNISCFCCK
jgi:hypothetical protein